MLKVLVACEFSGKVREAFRKLGHLAFSCDIIPCEPFSDYHFTCDVKDVISSGWDLMIAFPPCTHLCRSGARWWPNKQQEQKEAIDFVKYLLNVPIKHIALENPIGCLSTKIRKPDQIIQPWQFGHGEVKSTCLWLKNLPLLIPTNIVDGREQKCWKAPDSKGRSKKRSITYDGIAKAMAEQYSKYILESFKIND